MIYNDSKKFCIGPLDVRTTNIPTHVAIATTPRSVEVGSLRVYRRPNAVLFHLLLLVQRHGANVRTHDEDRTVHEHLLPLLDRLRPLPSLLTDVQRARERRRQHDALLVVGMPSHRELEPRDGGVRRRGRRRCRRRRRYHCDHLLCVHVETPRARTGSHPGRRMRSVRRLLHELLVRVLHTRADAPSGRGARRRLPRVLHHSCLNTTP